MGATTDRPSERLTEQVVRHTTCGALSNNQGLDRDVGKERRGKGPAMAEDDHKLTGGQQMVQTLQPHKSFTLGNTFTDVCVWLCFMFKV